MDTLEFFQRVLPGSGTYCAFGALGDRVKQVFAATLTDLEAHTTKLDAQGYDTYQALATFNDAAGGRKQANVQAIKSFYLDIDCKDPAIHYATWREALIELGKFVTDTGLPAPMVIRSGGGLHVYWPLDQELVPAQWQPVANALKALCVAKGLKIDPAITADSARVLRTPGTTHTKTGRKVTVVMDAPDSPLAAIVSALQANSQMVVPAAPAPPKYSLVDTLLSRPELPPADSNIVEMKCKQVNWAANNQKDILEPMWYALLGVAAYCHDAEKTAERWSNQHPSYDQHATLNKMDQWKRQTTGPATCKRLESENPKGCDGCRYKGIISSPVQIGAQFAEAAPPQVADPTAQMPLPKPFKRTIGGMVITIDDTDIEICPFDIYPVSYGYDENLGYEIARFKWDRQHVGWKDLVFRQSMLVDGAYKEFSGAIADQGIVLYNRKRTETFQLMLRSYMDELRKMQSVTNHYSSMGWKENFSQFLVGETMLARDVDGVVTETTSSMSMANSRHTQNAYAQSGTYQAWRQLTKVLDTGAFPVHALALCVSLSSVFYAFTGLKGVTLSFYGETGSGKTLAQKWMQSVWGNPDELHFAAKFTLNSLFHRLSTHCHLPMTVDEATMMADKDVGDFIYWVSQGKDKARLTKTISERDQKGWATVVTLSTNKSIASKIAAAGMESDAQQVRLLELNVPVSEVFSGSSGTGSGMYNAIHQHYGHAGREFVRKLMELGPDKLREMTVKAPALFKERFKVTFTGQERYWEQLLSLAYLAAVLAHKWDIIRYDAAPAFEWALKQLNLSRTSMKENKRDSFDLLAEYLNENAGHSVTVMHTHGLKSAADLTRLPRDEIRVRYDVYRKSPADPFTHGTVLVDAVHFRKWSNEEGYDYKAISTEIKGAGADATPRTRKALLTKDTGLKGAQQYVFGIKMNHAVFSGVFDSADQAADNLTFGQFAVVNGDKK